MTLDDVLKSMEKLASHDPKDLAGMARFGINVDKAWVISIPKLRALAKEIRKNVGDMVEVHELAELVWETGIHEAKILAGFMDYPELVTRAQMEKWVLGFDSWDVTDMVCTNLFDRTQYAYTKALEWAERKEEFVKRAGFVLMAGLAVHDKSAGDEAFYPFLESIRAHSTDERNFVRKAVNWALRQIGKSRTKVLYMKTLHYAHAIVDNDDKTSRWIGGDAIRELEKEYIRKGFVL